MQRKWDVTKPEDISLMGKGAEEIRKLKEDIQDHLIRDHQMNDVVDPLQGDCSGYHNKVTFYPLDDDPIVPLGAGVTYCKVIDGVQELFFIDSENGIVNQLTENGVISLNTLQNDLDGNKKIIHNFFYGDQTELLQDTSYSAVQLAYISAGKNQNLSETKYYTITNTYPIVLKLEEQVGAQMATFGTCGCQFFWGRKKSGTSVVVNNYANSPFSSNVSFGSHGTVESAAWFTRSSRQILVPAGVSYLKVLATAQMDVTLWVHARGMAQAVKVIDASLPEASNVTIVEGWS